MLDDITKLERLRDNLIATGKVIPANFDPVFKIVMLDCPNYLAFLVSSFTNIPKESIKGSKGITHCAKMQFVKVCFPF